MRTRKAIMIDPKDQARIVSALEHWPVREGFVGYRTRAFVYLLWDGAFRTGAALALNVEDVVKDPLSNRIHVVPEAVMRPREANLYQARRFFMSERACDAIADYLREARSEGWLA